jgi:arylsulfatase
MRRTLILVALFIIAASGCSQKEPASTEADTAPEPITKEEQPSAKPDGPPNIVIFLLDDTGYSDFGVYGSEINTPNIDRLAANGVQFSNYHTPATCSPTRSMMLTGVDNHLTGMGNMIEIMADNQFDQPGYEGYMSNRVVTVATLLKDAGYHTYMAGKWHLG